ncbi:POTRA domain-containing protein, partial [candidate division CSSED10-310 bacterium]
MVKYFRYILAPAVFIAFLLVHSFTIQAAEQIPALSTAAGNSFQTYTNRSVQSSKLTEQDRVDLSGHLEQKKPLISKIILKQDNIYPPCNGNAPSFPYSLVNTLHFMTSRHVLERELLLAEGDRFDAALLTETERNLRAFPYFQRVSVTAKENPTGNFDVSIHTIDAWTTKLFFAFRRTGGEMQGKIGMIEENLLGRGKYLATYFSSEPERESVHFYYNDPRLLGHYFSSQFLYISSSDLDRIRLKLIKPFISTLTTWAFEFNGERENGWHTHYDSGEEAFRFLPDHRVFNLIMAVAPSVSTSKVLRYSFGYRFLDDRFGIGNRPLEHHPSFSNSLYSGIFGALDYKKIDFVKEYNLDTYNRDEDFNVGNQFSFEIGYAPLILGSSANALFLQAEFRNGISFKKGHLLLGSAHVDVRFQERRFENCQSKFEIHHYYRIQERVTLWNHVTGTFLYEADPQNQFILGGDSGLQGYALHYFTGNKGLLFNSETRILLFNDVLKLFTVGGVLFCDAGNAWPEKEPLNLSELHYDVGLGIRVTFPRSSSSNIIKVVYSYAF